jgi:hypothetical protein
LVSVVTAISAVLLSVSRPVVKTTCLVPEVIARGPGDPLGPGAKSASP